ncbi:GLPGLI family protein [Flavobacterium sandaracinum]|uniref:GLPGLI family protein n=1 Tax=Flavobacterium sandaracinum TaxID=2541733 RepID=A0A4V2Z169_9FLAO|nr:GLPGLI family protein [Flavobacterium sandaracinum]TDE03688.1 GLPGLI family protein [Flavobacterium sandaracinum]
MNYNFFSIVLILFFNFTTAQTLKAILIEKPIKGIGDETTLSDKALKPMIFSYLYSENKSIQNLISNEKSSIDTTYIEKYGIKHQTTSSISRPSSFNRFKDFNLKKLKIVFTQDNKDINIKESLPVFKWKLISESQTINGYVCKKATTINTTFNSNQSIVAWYTEDIPINDGPMHYSGLPGFIIQVEISDITVLTFDKLVFNKENTPIEEPNNRATEMSFSDYSKQSNK